MFYNNIYLFAGNWNLENFINFQKVLNFAICAFSKKVSSQYDTIADNNETDTRHTTIRRELNVF